jgi:2-methylisocitrate lyase-like PEP mutase family enzyme
MSHQNYAARILLQNGFKARSISGGMLSRSMLTVDMKSKLAEVAEPVCD